MSDIKNALSERIKDSGNSTPTEHLLNILRAGLSTAPFCGGIASLMTDYIPTSKQKRIEEFVELIAKDLDKLQKKVNENLILTDDYAFIFEKCFRGAAENYQKEKLQSFRGILINSAIGYNLKEEEKEYYLNLVTTLSTLHIKILKFMATPLEYLENEGVSKEKINGGFSQFFPIAIPGVDIEVIKSAFGDLYQYGFINTDKSIFSTMTSGQGLDLLGGRVSVLGKQFINFCRVPNE
jgi:hypothetical protein